VPHTVVVTTFDQQLGHFESAGADPPSLGGRCPLRPAPLAPLVALGLALALRVAEPAPVQELHPPRLRRLPASGAASYTDVPVRIDIDDASLERIGHGRGRAPRSARW
jgi:hypothetical protein